MTGKDKVDSNLWFMGAAQRVGAATTRQVRGHLNMEIPQQGRLQMRRVAVCWNSLLD